MNNVDKADVAVITPETDAERYAQLHLLHTMFETCMQAANASWRDVPMVLGSMMGEQLSAALKPEIPRQELETIFDEIAKEFRISMSMTYDDAMQQGKPQQKH